MIDWEWLKNINAFQGCVGQFMGFVGMIIGVAGTYIVTTLNYTRQNKKEEKRKVGLKLLASEITSNNNMLSRGEKSKVRLLSNSSWHEYKHCILIKEDDFIKDILDYYKWIDLLCNFDSNTKLSNEQLMTDIIKIGKRILDKIK